jgi:hypothetical protein
VSVAELLAGFALHTEGDSVSERVRSRGVLHMLDTLGCGLAAVGLGEGGHATAVALAQEGRPEASVIGSGTVDRFIDNSPGTPRNPLDEQWVLGKFRSSASLALGADAYGAVTGGHSPLASSIPRSRRFSVPRPVRYFRKAATIGRTS